MILKAPAKINWFLRVLGKRPDGYHEIASLMQKITLHDMLSIEEADELILDSDMQLPPQKNLVFRAAEQLREFSGCRCGARISLKKQIPSEAGLGGGSSDAAAALNGLNRFWALGLDKSDLMGLGAKLGSDIPFFLGTPAGVAEGRGEIITPVRVSKSYSLLLVKPQFGVSTAQAYGSISILTKKTVDIKLFCRALDTGDFGLIKRLVLNDLEAAVLPLHKEIASIKKSLVEQGAEVALMSGSGSAVFGLFKTAELAQRAAENFDGLWRRVVETLSGEG